MHDWQLIEDFVARGSDSAFQTLVSRYINLVRSTALRGVKDAALADEVTQAVFILLARKAAKIQSAKNQTLGGWLYRTTRFVASRALRGENRRRRREQEAFNMQQLSSTEDAWRRIAPILDEGIEKLDAASRDALILRFFQGEAFAAVGQSLGISEEAARKRVDRSIDKLRAFFTRRGFTISAAAVASGLAAFKAEAVPTELAAAVGAKALLGANSGMAALPALVIETLQAWHWATLKFVAGLGAIAMAIGLAATIAWADFRPSGSPPSSVAVPTNHNQTVAAQGAPPAKSKKHEVVSHFQLNVVDAATGKPVANARVFAMSARDPRQIDRQPELRTDANGQCDIGLPYANPMAIFAGVVADGYEERSVVGGMQKPLGSNYTMRLPAGATIGGVVVDKAGQPVADASIQVQFTGTGDYSNREFKQERPGIPDDNLDLIRTDHAGHWIFRSAPTNGEFWMQIKHPDFPGKSFRNDTDDSGVAQAAVLKLQDLLATNAVLTLDDGLSLRGTVTDEYGYALAQAKVMVGRFAGQSHGKQVEADGSFQLRALSPGQTYVTVTSEGFAPQRLEVEVTSNTTPLAIKLKPGGLLKVRVVDRQGAPLPGAWLGVERWQDYNTLDWRGFADHDGWIIWKSAPLEPIEFSVLKEGYITSRRNELTADGKEHDIVLQPQVMISGHVTDSETGQPIASFKVVPGELRMNTAYGKSGTYQIVLSEIEPRLVLNVEAAGYQTASWPVTNLQQTNQTLDCTLNKLGTGNTIQGVVLLPDGSPAAGATVTLRVSAMPLDFTGGKKLRNRQNNPETETDAEGHFTIGAVAGAQWVVANNERGIGAVSLKDAAGKLSITLSPWGRIEGVLKLKDRPVASQGISLMTSQLRDSAEPYHVDCSASTDDQGNFVFDKVPPGRGYLYLRPAGGEGRFTHQTPVEVQPGATTQAQIGGHGGALVSGKLTWSGAATNIDWAKQTFYPSFQTRLPYPPGLKGMKRAQWYQQFSKTEAGQAAIQSQVNYDMNVQSDGSFTIEDVPPGGYEIRVQLLKEPVDFQHNFRGNNLGFANQEVDIPAVANGGPFDLGNIQVQTVQRIQVQAVKR